MALQESGGKLPGKTKYSGRRRITTRKSGFKSHPDSTGGELQSLDVETFAIPAGERLTVEFNIPAHTTDDLVGYGGWFFHAGNLDISIEGGFKRRTLKDFPSPCWGKIGSLWQSGATDPITVYVHFDAVSKTDLAFWELGCGVIQHDYYTSALENEEPARLKRLLSNMYQFAPEAIFLDTEGESHIRFDGELQQGRLVQINLKSCNRCARFLPVNMGTANYEQNHLSFSNHCKAAHLLPCKHGGFGILKDQTNGRTVRLQHGFQLECRFCKKFAVNAALNPLRTAAQMKEDAARRRAFELLLMELYGGSPQLLYRHETGKELTDVIWEAFDRKCFACEVPLESPREMNLDHTRPLALLWPLDGTATALCKACNSEKRDRPPSAFYSDDQIELLADITGLDPKTLLDPSPNIDALDRLAKRLNWFFNEFLTTDEMTKERDGKIAGELLVKAIHKVDTRRIGGPKLNLPDEYDARRRKKK
jgi:hypothetical protein